MNIHYFCNQKATLVNVTINRKSERKGQCVLSVFCFHHVGFGLKILEVGFLHPRHGLVIVQVLTHLHVLRVAHEEGMSCCYGFLQLVYLRVKNKNMVATSKPWWFVSKCAVHSKQEIPAFLSLPLSVPQPLPSPENTPIAGTTYQRLEARGPGQVFSYFPNQH